MFGTDTFSISASAPAGQGSTTNALVWSGTDWSAGANNVYPANHTTISSYDTLDQAVTYVCIHLNLVFALLTIDPVRQSFSISKNETNHSRRSLYGRSGMRLPL